MGALPQATATLADKAANAFSRRDWATARACYLEMLKADPENALAWANLGAVEQQDGKLDKAVAAFEASVRFNPQLVQSWLALGNLLSSQGDRYRAISCFTRALHEDPLDPRAHNLLAIEVKNIGWRDAALQELQRAIELKPDYGLAHFNLATMYLDQKPPATLLAKRHYEQALALGEKRDEVLERRLREE
jgi:tetratricopeptide (TPR) repeat protein